MAKDKTYTIEIENLETVAYLRAIINTAVEDTVKCLQGEHKDNFDRIFPGGIEGARVLETRQLLADGCDAVWRYLTSILDSNGITSNSAPWLKPQAPDEIDGNKIDYRGKDGIKFGCNNQYALSLDQMREMVKKCEEAG